MSAPPVAPAAISMVAAAKGTQRARATMWSCIWERHGFQLWNEFWMEPGQAHLGVVEGEGGAGLVKECLLPRFKYLPIVPYLLFTLKLWHCDNIQYYTVLASFKYPSYLICSSHYNSGNSLYRLPCSFVLCWQGGFGLCYPDCLVSCSTQRLPNRKIDTCIYSNMHHSKTFRRSKSKIKVHKMRTWPTKRPWPVLLMLFLLAKYQAKRSTHFCARLYQRKSWW